MSEERIAMQRFDIGDSGVNYAYAWEEGVELEGMERVVWKSVQYIGDTQPFERWVVEIDDSREWDSIRREFISRQKI